MAALVAAQAAPPVKARNLDAAVIEAALLQFFSPEEEEWQSRDWRKGETVLLWGQLASKKRERAADVLKAWIDPAAAYEWDPRDGKRVTEMLAPLRALQAEIAGVQGGFVPPPIVPLASLEFGPKIAVGEPRSRSKRAFRMWYDTELPNGQPGRPRVIARIEPPACSADGRIALPKLNAPWSIHSADVLIGLRKVGDAWERVFAVSQFYV